MSLTLPQLLPECNVSAQHFCPTCRDREKGRAFRKTILGIRKIEGVEVDFECPRNKPWDVPAPPPGYGTRFHSLLLFKYSIPACKPCFDQVERMNKMSFDEAVAEKRSILESIWTRKDDAPGWRSLAARLPFAKHLAFYELGSMYDEAIAEIEE